MVFLFYAFKTYSKRVVIMLLVETLPFSKYGWLADIVYYYLISQTSN